jgi:glycosyltransferase involved in cell wall biosynthesis
VKLAAISHLASPDAPTGAERSLAGLAAALRGRGHEVGVVAPGPWCLASDLEAAGVQVATIPSRAAWLVQWGPQPPATQLLRWLRWRLPDPGLRRMMVWLDRFWPEVVHVNCLPQLKGAAAARALGLPVVWHVREILPPGRRRRWFARRLRRDARRIVAVSDAVASWLADEGLGERVTVVRNGVDVPVDPPEPVAARTALGLPPDGVLVGFLGGMAVHKGALDLVEAAERALTGAPQLGVVMATFGPPDRVEAVRGRLAASSARDRIQLIPPVDDVFGLLAAVDVVAFSSVWPDSLPRVVMEAMAAGRPVVAYRTGGVPEMVADGETGILVEPGDVDGLARGLVELARDEELRRRMGEAAAVRARTELSVAKHVDAMERLLLEAAAPRGS